MAKRPGGAMIQNTLPTKSQLIPVLTKWQDLGKKSQLGPMLVTIIAFFLMVSFGDTAVITIEIEGSRPGTILDPRHWIYTSNFLILFASYLTLVSLYFIYRLVGKNKSWWVLLGAMVFTGYFLWLFQVAHYFEWIYDFFHNGLAGGEPDDSGPFLQLFVRHFLGTGFFEELVKALPLFALVLLQRYMSPAIREKIAIEEPLDGILIGAASGGGFALMETLGQYVPRQLVGQWIKFSLVMLHGVKFDQLATVIDNLNPQQAYNLINESKNILGTAPAVHSLMIRSLDLAFGHMAYSGYFGYFIGLAVLKPDKRWKILGIGLVSASIPHALWDSVLSLDIAPLSAAVAFLSYAVLAAAILKAREISPNRLSLQPSVIFGGVNPAPAAQSDAAAARPAYDGIPSVPAFATAARNPLPAGTSSLRVGAKYLVIVAGLRLLEHQVPGLQSQSNEGLVAEVTRNPNDPEILGLTNLSTTAWEVVTSSNTRREIQPGHTVRLTPGTMIDFGSTDGEVR